MRRSLLIAVPLIACALELPAGEPLYAVSGGWCDGGCPQWTVYRDGTKLALAEWDGDELERVNHGALTPTGEAALVTAAQEFGPELADALERCIGPTSTTADGAEYAATLERDGMSYTLRYCIGSEEFGIDMLHELMMSIVVALGTCTANEWTTIEKCKS